MGIPHGGGRRKESPGGASDDFVEQEVAEGLGDGQRLHLVRGGHPAEGHAAQVLQAGDATGALPEVHAAVAGPGGGGKGADRGSKTWYENPLWNRM